MKSKVNFSKITPFYDLLGTVTFGGHLQKSQIYALELYPESVDSILIIGGGTGKFLIELIKHLKFNHLVYLDISPAMINSAKQKIAKYSPESLTKVEFILGGENKIPNQEFELIVTHYFLDCLTPETYSETVEKLNRCLKQDGVWSMVDFYNAERNPIREQLISLLYCFFRITCNLPTDKLIDFDIWFEKNMRCVKSKEFAGGLLKSSLYKKLD